MYRVRLTDPDKTKRFTFSISVAAAALSGYPGSWHIYKSLITNLCDTFAYLNASLKPLDALSQCGQVEDVDGSLGLWESRLSS